VAAARSGTSAATIVRVIGQLCQNCPDFLRANRGDGFARHKNVADYRTGWLIAGLVGGLSLSTSAALAAERPIDTERSTLTVRVFKTGLFSAFGDDHEIRGPVAQGVVDDGDPGAVRIVIDAHNLRVIDSASSQHDREQVQTRMLSPEVLDVDRFSEIRFESTAVERAPSGGWLVHGQLTLHGQTRPLTVTVVRQDEHYKGSVLLKQTDFGMTPISIVAGTVKVKNEVKIEFDIVTRSQSTTGR
jgi:polyisoprenoid-binding protein YceI